MLKATVLPLCIIAVPFSVFRDHHLQDQPRGVVPDPAGDPQLASGYEALVHRVLARHRTEPVRGARAASQRQPTSMQGQAHRHHGEDARGRGGADQPQGGRGASGHVDGAT